MLCAAIKVGLSKLTCTAAAIIAFLGWMPPKGTVITVPRSALKEISRLDQAKAKLCAMRHGIRWKIEDDK